MSWLSDIGDWFKKTGEDIYDWFKEGYDWHNSEDNPLYTARKKNPFNLWDDEPGKIFNWAKEQVEASTGDAANKTNKEIADQNLEFQRETFEYEKELQKQLFEREDTANQRTVNDMRLAGLNPLNMQGTNGAGDVVGITTPQNEYQESPTRGLDFIDTFFNSALQAKANNANNSLLKAQSNLMNQQAESQRIQNLYQSQILQAQIAGLLYDNKSKFFNNQNQIENYLFNRKMGWTENTPDWLKSNSVRFGYIPFRFNWKSKDDIMNPLINPFSSWYPEDLNYSGLTQEDMKTNLLADELLTGSMGMFGTLFKFLLGGK